MRSVRWLLVLVLALDTSTPSVTAGVVRLLRPHEFAAAVHRDSTGVPKPSELLAEESVTDPYAHAERLMPLAKAALDTTGRTVKDLDAVVVGLGPGPFTGLRVGIATAAALGDGLDIPVHGVPSHDGTLRSLASLLSSKTPGQLLVVTDARRREVYVSAYRSDGSKVLGPMVVAPAQLPALLAGHGVAPDYVTGAGAQLLDAHRGASFDPEFIDSADVAKSLGLVERAAIALLTGAVPDPLTPLYLRRPDATEPGARKSVLGR
jgi:tRNA threonylcarbamoyl adenosine modification protein YeaZ